MSQEEIFGLVLTVTADDTEDEAVSIANNSIYGLSGEVSSGDASFREYLQGKMIGLPG